MDEIRLQLVHEDHHTIYASIYEPPVLEIEELHGQLLLQHEVR